MVSVPGARARAAGAQRRTAGGTGGGTRARSGRRQRRGGRGQGRGAAHRARRQGGRVLSARAARRRRRDRCAARVRAFRLHVGGHQQSLLRADAEGGARPGTAARDRQPRPVAARARAPLRGAADAVAHARPAGEPDHARQGTGQRRRPARACARRVRGGRGARQAEWRGRQLERARRRLPGHRLARGGRALRRKPRPRLERVHGADRAARLDRRVLRCAGAPRHDPDRFRTRHVGIHIARLLPAARGRGRGRQPRRCRTR